MNTPDPTQSGRDETIYIDGDVMTEVPPRAKCTCGWETEPMSELNILGRLAFEHRDETGHGLRKHSDSEDD